MTPPKKRINWTKIGVIIAIIGIIVPLVYDKIVSNNRPVKENNDTVDNKNAINPITIFGDNNELDITNNIPEPQFSTRTLSANEFVNDLYKTEIILTITSTAVIPSLYFKAEAATIVKMQAIPQNNAGMYMLGQSGTGNGFAYTNLINAQGEYKIILFSRQKESYQLYYDY